MPSRLTLPILLALALSLSGCAARQAHLQEPAPCSDSLYVELRRQHPDSLSEREWQRLQTLEQACAAVRTQRDGDMNGMMGMGSGRGLLWMGLVMVGIGMVITMGRLR